MSLLNTDSLKTAWTQRRRRMRADRLQDYADMLYDHLAADFGARHAEIDALLRATIAGARNKEELRVPIWTFVSSLYEQPLAEIKYTDPWWKMEHYIRRKGHEWMVGLMAEDAAPFTTEDVDNTMAWGNRWVRTPVSVYSVLKHTDVAARLALLFGQGHFRIGVELTATKRLPGSLAVTARKYNLVLHYYPDGMPFWAARAEEQVADKYRDYVSGYHWTEQPARREIWTGLAETAGVSNATPPPRRRSDTPPPLMRRSNGGGIYTYEGEDALQQAARDTLASIMAEGAPCHCGYDHPEDE